MKLASMLSRNRLTDAGITSNSRCQPNQLDGASSQREKSAILPVSPGRMQQLVTRLTSPSLVLMRVHAPSRNHRYSCVPMSARNQQKDPKAMIAAMARKKISGIFIAPYSLYARRSHRLPCLGSGQGTPSRQVV